MIRTCLWVLIGIFASSLGAFGETKVLFLGDSLTAGYGIPKSKNFPSLIQQRLIETNRTDIKILNGGVSGATTASGESRLKWFKKQKPSVVILALGANDGLRGMKPKESEKFLSRTIEAAQKQGIKVLLVGMKLPLNYGQTYREEFEAMYTRLAERYKVPLLPFLLEGVGGIPDLNLPDGIHPNEKGHEIIAQTVFNFLLPHL